MIIYIAGKHFEPVIQGNKATSNKPRYEEAITKLTDILTDITETHHRIMKSYWSLNALRRNNNKLHSPWS